MNRQEFDKLKPGDKVRIVSKKNGAHWNSAGRMDKWLGKVMTVSVLYYSHIKMVEDQDEGIFRTGWYWYPEMIKCKIIERIEIILDGNKTIARRDNRVGIARCLPTDAYDPGIGAHIALERLLHGKDADVSRFLPKETKEASKKDRDADKLPFEIGDRVRLKPYDEVSDHIAIYAMTWQKLSAFEGEIVKIEQGPLHRGLIVFVSFPGSGYAPLCFLSSSLIKCPQLSFSFGDLVSVGGSCPRIDLRGDIGVVTNDAEPYSVTMRRTGHSETIEGKYLWRAKK